MDNIIIRTGCRAGHSDSILILVCLLMLVSSVTWGDANLVTNGGFELVGNDGRPEDWEYVGQSLSLTDQDVHSGRLALQIIRESEQYAETGLNRTWQQGSGQAGKMLTQRRGGLSYWYKAIRGNAKFMFQAIPMSDKPIEDTGSPRVTWEIPAAHIGDGRWHEARFAYDFTDNPKVRYVHVAVRLMGGTGEILVDDVQWLDKVGPALRFTHARLWLDPHNPAEQGVLRCKLANIGDEPLANIQVDLDLPDGLTAGARETLTEAIQPSEEAFLSWTIRGRRIGQPSIGIVAQSGDAHASTSVICAAQLEIESLLADPFLSAPGKNVMVTAKVVNRGTAISTPLALRLVSRDAEVLSPETQMTSAIPSQAEALVAWKAWIRQEGEARLVCQAEGHEPVESRIIVSSAASTEPEPLFGNVWVRHGSDREVLEIHASDGTPIAIMPSLGSLTIRNEMGDPEQMNIRGSVTRTSDGKQCDFSFQHRDSDGGQWMVHVFMEAVSKQIINVRYQVTCDKLRHILAFDGPMLYVPGEHKEALFPGLEWLEEGEISSSDLDIARDHPDRLRYVPHPNKVTVPLMSVRTEHGVVGLLWDMKQEWTKGYDRPQPVFAVPDRFSGRNASLMGLMLPNVPSGLAENTRITSEPFRLPANQPLSLEAQILYAPDATSVLDSVDAWFSVHQPMAVLPWPQGDDPSEQVGFSMQGYMKSLWVNDGEGWLPFLGGPSLGREPAHRADYAYDLLVGAQLYGGGKYGDEAEWDARARDQLRRANAYPAGEDLGFRYRDPLLAVRERIAAAERQLATMQPDGTWVFDADRVDRGVFKGLDYYELGSDGAVELGTLARHCYEVLWYARITGDRQTYERMIPTLERMAEFTVSRAAQVWEVPVHTPDILAAADAVEAFIEAYGISGEERWLDQAKYWAKAGLPFIYVWDADPPERQWMRYGSIPVFGATWYQGSWFGRIVQWNGLRYAYALMKLWSYDRDGIGGVSWMQFANGITASACYQQSTEGENLALWPDAYGTIDGVRVNWDFAPNQILKQLAMRAGWAPEPRTIWISPGQEVTENVLVASDGLPNVPHAVVSGLPLHSAKWEGDMLEIRVAVRSWIGPPGYLLVSGVTEPTRVTVGGSGPFDSEMLWSEVPQREGLLSSPETWDQQELGWSYDPTDALLRIELQGSFNYVYVCEGVRPARGSSLALPVASLNFEFDQDTEGWHPANDLTDFGVQEGVLTMRITGGDPYLTRSFVRVDAAKVPGLTILARDGEPWGDWQLFFITEASPRWDETKSIRVKGYLRPNRWAQLRFPLVQNPHWRGTVIGIRLDPPGAPPHGKVDINWIREGLSDR